MEHGVKGMISSFLFTSVWARTSVQFRYLAADRRGRMDVSVWFYGWICGGFLGDLSVCHSPGLSLPLDL
jgi:hypothetical protein